MKLSGYQDKIVRIRDHGDHTMSFRRNTGCTNTIAKRKLSESAAI